MPNVRLGGNLLLMDSGLEQFLAVTVRRLRNWKWGNVDRARLLGDVLMSLLTYLKLLTRSKEH